MIFGPGSEPTRATSFFSATCTLDRFTTPATLAAFFVPTFPDFVGVFDRFGAAAFWTSGVAVLFGFDFEVSAVVADDFLVVTVPVGALVVVVGVTGSGLATTASTTAETFTRLVSLATELVVGGSAAMLSAVTGVFTVTCSIATASTSTECRTGLDDVAIRDCVEAATRTGKVGWTVVAGWVVVGCVAGGCVAGGWVVAG
jgi:hypothetical protein